MWDSLLKETGAIRESVWAFENIPFSKYFTSEIECRTRLSDSIKYVLAKGALVIVDRPYSTGAHNTSLREVIRMLVHEICRSETMSKSRVLLLCPEGIMARSFHRWVITVLSVEQGTLKYKCDDTDYSHRLQDYRLIFEPQEIASLIVQLGTRHKQKFEVRYYDAGPEESERVRFEWGHARAPIDQGRASWTPAKVRTYRARVEKYKLSLLEHAIYGILSRGRKVVVAAILSSSLLSILFGQIVKADKTKPAIINSKTPSEAIAKEFLCTNACDTILSTSEYMSVFDGLSIESKCKFTVLLLGPICPALDAGIVSRFEKLENASVIYVGSAYYLEEFEEDW
jgi:hypothetical protein